MVGYGIDEEKNEIYASVDGIDLMIREQTPFDGKWWSPKYYCAALRYEMDISVMLGEVVWMFGPSPSGKYSDQRIYKRK